MAVYTQVSDEELARFVAGHGLGELRFVKGIAEGVENTNYLIETQRGRYILTIYEKRVAPQSLPYYLGLMEHLSAKGIACPLPVRDGNGQQIAQLAGRLAAIVTFLEGVSLRQPAARHCELVGEGLARLHHAGLDYPSRLPNALGPEGWEPLFQGFRERADEIRPGLVTFIETELATLLPAWPARLPQGVIHADLFPDNAFFLGDRLSGIIDFYFACNDMLAYDVAICLNAWCFDDMRRFDRDKAAALLAGYQRARPLEPAERAALPTLARGAALRFLLTRANDWLTTPKDAIVKPHDPADYVARIEQHRAMTSARDYGLEA
jgi:homoserine kinase type II